MKKDDFFFELHTLILQFEDAFNDIVIDRYNKNKVSGQQLKVNFKYAPKSRVLYDLVNKSQHIKLPIVAVSIKSIRRDVNRVFNKIDGSYWKVFENDNVTHLLQPVPVDVTVNMSILTRYQLDMDQIIANFIPYTDPYVVVSWRLPNLTQEIRSHIIWNEDITLNYPMELTPNTPTRVEADTTFTIKGWLFKDISDTSDKIYKVTTTFTSVSEIFSRYATMSGFQSPISTDTFTTSARPFIMKAIPYLTVVSGINQFAVIGEMFKDVTNVYVSADNFDVYLTEDFYNPISGHTKISGSYPGFSGIEIQPFNVDNEHTISFNLPSAFNTGFIDVIAVNEAGYGQLTVDSRRPTTNPYPTEVEPQYSSYTEQQHESVDGIEVKAL